MMQQGIRKIENNRKTILKNKLIEYINTNVNEDNPKQTSEKLLKMMMN